MDKKIRLIAVVGPTGVGKTQIGMAVAEKLKTEIISCDSMQIYRYMNIGTAKPTPEQQSEIRHHMIDIVNPDENYDAAEYRKQAGGIISHFQKENKIPLIVGGTGFYLRALVDGLFEEVKIPKDFRKVILNKWSEISNPVIHEELSKVDPEAAGRIHSNDRKRMLRALEVYEFMGVPISKLQKEQQKEESLYDLVIIGLFLPREELYERINHRVVRMFKTGWIEEVKMLRKIGYSLELQPMQSLGYKYINQYLDGNCSEKDMVELTQRDTRRYAKRQMTWFRADKRVQWLNLHEKSLKEIVLEIEARSL